MRPIKFRVWDIEQKKMRLIVTDIHWALHGVTSCRYMDTYTNTFYLVNDEDCVGGKRRFILMQNVGRKDKMGRREVYVDDIVKVKDVLPGSENADFIGVVGFQDCSFVIETEWSMGYRWMDYEIEIIGNIHENKGLLNES